MSMGHTLLVLSVLSGLVVAAGERQRLSVLVCVDGGF